MYHLNRSLLGVPSVMLMGLFLLFIFDFNTSILGVRRFQHRIRPKFPCFFQYFAIPGGDRKTDHTIFHHRSAYNHLSTLLPDLRLAGLLAGWWKWNELEGFPYLCWLASFRGRCRWSHYISSSTCTYPSLHGIKLLALSRLSETMDGLARWGALFVLVEWARLGWIGMFAGLSGFSYGWMGYMNILHALKVTLSWCW